MKPLYLDGREPLSIYVDGPALCISQNSHSLQRFPFSKVSRVLVSGQVSWTTESLLQCADNGITVSFLDANGGLRASLCGNDSKRSQLAQLWDDFLYRPDSEEIYQIWSDATRTRAKRIAKWRIRTYDRVNMRAFQNLYENLSDRSSCYQVMRELNQHLAALANSRSRQIMAGVSISPKDDAGTELLSDMEFVIQCGLCPELITFCRNNKHVRDGGLSNPFKVAIEFYERNQSAVEFHIRDFLRRLKRHLRQVCDAHQ